MARSRRVSIGEALDSDRPDFDPAFVALWHDYVDRECPGEPGTTKLLTKLLLENREWRSHLVERAGRRGELVVRRVQRIECLRRIRKGGLLEFIRGGWGADVENREGVMVDGLPVIPGGWGVLEPNNPFIEGKHLDVLTRVLEAVTYKTGEYWEEISKATGGVADLLINIPPSTMKSLTVNVFWFAWCWAEVDGGTSRWLFWTYAKELSERDSQRARALVQSEWYAWLYPHIELSRSQNEKHRFDSTRHGVRIATSVEGGGTGEGGNYIVFDDPHKAREAMYSDKIRETTINAWKSTMTNRQRPPNSGARVGIMQRLHPMDLTGYLLDTGLWYHLVLPMRYRKAHPYLSVFDWRKDEDELLWPAFLPLKKVLQIEAEMGSEEIVAGQHEQLPTAAGGNIFKRDWFQPWFAGEDPHFEFVLQSYDTAFTEETRNDPSAMLTFGLFLDVTRKHPDHAPSGRMSVLIREGWQERLAYPDLRERVQQQFREREYGRGEAKRILLGEPLIKPADWDSRGGISEWSRGRRPDMALIEEKGSGLALKLDLERAGVPVQGYNPGRMDKIARAHAVSHLVKQRCVYLPAYWVDQQKGRWKFFDWAEALVRELIAFPKYPSDHWTDCFTQALAVFRDMSMLRATEDERYDERDDTSQGDDGLVIEHKAENPYFA